MGSAFVSPTKISATPNAKFVGPSADDKRRNCVRLYRLDFTLSAIPDGAVLLNLFADSRYRLWVNGELVSVGPARFVTAHPQYDTIDLRRHLRIGANCFAVDVHAYNSSSFQTMPDSREGFIAWGAVEETSFSTPGNWCQRRVDAWADDAALFSFAQNAAEIFDSRLVDPDWYAPDAKTEGWASPRTLLLEEAIWGAVEPRAVPPPPLELAVPSRVVVSGARVNAEMIFGFHFPRNSLGRHPSFTQRMGQVFRTYIFSPKQQRVSFAHHWGEFWLNGHQMLDKPTFQRGLRAERSVPLNEGWNCLAGHLEFLPLTEFYDAVFALQGGLGLKIAARPEEGVEAAFAIAGDLVPMTRVGEWLMHGMPVKREGWVEVSGNGANLTPGRFLAWQKLDELSAKRDVPFSKLDGLVGPHGNLWVFDFGREVIGHLALEIEGAPGQIVDVGYDEWLQPNGLIDLYRTNPFVHCTERYILRGGKQSIVGLNSRGARFLQIAIYPADGSTPARLHSVGVRLTRAYGKSIASIQTNNSVDRAIFEASVNTFVGSTEDAYSDSPWRERGSYVGDFTVNQLVNRLVTHDLSFAVRALRVFAQGQLSNGQIPATAPACHRKEHEDFSLIWILGIWEHWSITGDTGAVADLWPNIEKLWASSSWKADEHGLWSAEGFNMFIDWGVINDERRGHANAVLNAFRILALECAAELATLIGKPQRAAELAAEAVHVRAAFSKALWIEDQGRYAPFLNVDRVQSLMTGAHTNALAWALKIGTPAQIARVEKYLFALLDRNFELGCSRGQFGGHIEFYFFRFLLKPLTERGHAERALALVRQHWGPVVSDAFGTLPECFCRFFQGIGSRCHGWSGYPAVWYMAYVLGLRQENAGDPARWILDPARLKTVNSAEGVLSHADGLIRVKWTRGPDGKLVADVSAPPSVSVTVRQ